MADKFFTEPEEEIQEENNTIKLGDKEYSQEDLSRLVGLGEIAAEAEEKYKTKIDRVWPEYTKATQAKSDLERKVQDLEAKLNQPTQTQTQDVTQLTEEQKQLVRRQMSDLGFSDEHYRQVVREELAAKELLSDIDYLIADAKSNGQPTTTPQDLLQHMQETGIKNPAKAYKDMYEDELDKLKEQKLASIKPSGMVTTSASTAGSKQPQPVKATRANLQQLVQEALNNAGN